MTNSRPYEKIIQMLVDGIIVPERLPERQKKIMEKVRHGLILIYVFQ